MKNLSTLLGKSWAWTKMAATRVWAWAKVHKVIAAIIVLAILGAGYYGYTNILAANSGAEYVLATVTRGPLQVTVTESGQVDSQDTLNVTPQGGASGQITYIGVTPGQSVKAGTIIARLDDTTAAEAVTSARQNLESAQISYQQTLTSSQASSVNDQTNVTTSEQNAVAALTTAYTNFPTVMQGLNTTLYGLSTIPQYNVQQNVDAYATIVNTPEAHTYHDQVEAAYTTAVTSYQTALAAYTAANAANASPASIEQLDQETLQATQDIDTALRDALTYYNYVDSTLNDGKQSIPSQLTTQISSLTTWQSTISSDNQSVTSSNTALVNAEQTLTQDTQTLANSSNGVPLNVQSAELNVEKAQASLAQAETTDADYAIVAPFDGTIATVPVNPYDQASSGTTIATLITNEEYTDISLNESDAAKVQLGQPVSMTFDAISGLTLTGKVAQIDPVGTVTQGVVTYDVRISFDQGDPRVKPGMSVTAVITTASEPSAIQVPSSAITTTNGISYVQVATLTNASSTLTANGGTGSTTRHNHNASSTAYTGAGYGGYGAGGFTGGTSTMATTTGAFSTTSAAFAARFAGMSRSITVPEGEVTIKRVPVTIGLSNDTMTEIVSGLQPGQLVVSSTISNSTKKSSAASATSLIGGSATRTGAGFTGGAGGTFRAGGSTGGAAVGGAGRGG